MKIIDSLVEQSGTPSGFLGVIMTRIWKSYTFLL